MKIDDHLEAFQEHKEAIEWAINRGIEKSQRIIGTHASRGAVELLSSYLHRINKMDIGSQVNHRWFKSEKVKDRFPDFPKKEKIINKMIKLENACESLTYSSKKTEKEIKDAVKLFGELETIFEELIRHDKIEE